MKTPISLLQAELDKLLRFHRDYLLNPDVEFKGTKEEYENISEQTQDAIEMYEKALSLLAAEQHGVEAYAMRQELTEKSMPVLDNPRIIIDYEAILDTLFPQRNK